MAWYNDSKCSKFGALSSRTDALKISTCATSRISLFSILDRLNGMQDYTCCLRQSLDRRLESHFSVLRPSTSSPSLYYHHGRLPRPKVSYYFRYKGRSIMKWSKSHDDWIRTPHFQERTPALDGDMSSFSSEQHGSNHSRSTSAKQEMHEIVSSRHPDLVMWSFNGLWKEGMWRLVVVLNL